MEILVNRTLKTKQPVIHYRINLPKTFSKTGSRADNESVTILEICLKRWDDDKLVRAIIDLIGVPSVYNIYTVRPSQTRYICSF